MESFGERNNVICNGLEKFLTIALPNLRERELAENFFEVRQISEKANCVFFSVGDPQLEEKLIQMVEEANQSNSDLYVGIALRNNNQHGRAEDCSFISFLVVDHDEIDGHKIKDLGSGEEREQARAKLLNLINSDTDFFPTMVVDSGNGFHAYFSLEKPVKVNDFAKEIERKTKWLAERFSNCPGDPAMIRIAQTIRLPGSTNFKNPQKPRVCKVINFNPGNVYSFDEIPESEIKVFTKVHQGHKSQNQSLDHVKYSFWKCGFLKFMRANPQKQTFQLWFGAASTLAHFGEEGREVFHELSRQYPRYTKNETNALFDKMLKSQQNGIGPITYEKLDEYGYCRQENENDLKSPVDFIEKIWRIDSFKVLGVTFDEETGRMIFNPNVFAEFYQNRETLLVQEGVKFFRYQNGVWNIFPDYLIEKDIFQIFQSVEKHRHQHYIGTKSLEALRLAVPLVKEMDVQKHLINLQNGMLDMKSFTLKPHDPGYVSTVQIPMNFDPNATCEKFEKFISDIMCEDPERIQVIQEIIGYLLTAETAIQKAFFFYGAGANGKSLLLDLITQLVGAENVSALSLTDVENAFRRSDLVGKMLNIATENEVSGRGFNSQYFKAIVSGDRITVENKYEKPISYSPICKLVFAVNNLPFSADKSYGLYRRVFIVPFDKIIAEDKADKWLGKTLTKELPGILNWALEGLKRLQSQGYEFTKSTAIDAAITRYKQDQDPMGDFMTDLILLDAGGRVKKAEMLERYDEWRQENGFGPSKQSTQRFWNTFRHNCKALKLPFEEQRSNGVRYLKGIVLKKPDRRTPSSVSDGADEVEKLLA